MNFSFSKSNYILGNIHDQCSSDDEMSEESMKKHFEELPDLTRDESSTTSEELLGRTVPPILSTIQTNYHKQQR